MMWGSPVERAQMHAGARRLRKTLEKIFHELGLKIADALGCDLGLHDAIGPAAEIHSSGGQCFVHGHEEISRSQNPPLGTERFLYRLPERDPDVFDSVMLVHIQIAARIHSKIKRAV